MRRCSCALSCVVLIAIFVFAGCSGLVAGNTAPPSTLDITNVQAAPITTSSSQVVWTTNVPANSSVDYGTSTAYGNSTPVDSTMVTSHQVTLSGLAAGTTYYYQVNSTDSTQPASQTVTAGQTASFSVAATGTAPLTYQWQKNSVAISGATSSSYTTPATTTSDSGAQFTVVVSNSAGSVTSGESILTVYVAPGAPSITTRQASRTVTAGQTTFFRVEATSTAPLTYQWQKNGVAISAATSSGYTIPVTSETIIGAILAHILFVFLQRLWNWFRQPNLTLLVIPYPKSPNAIRTTPPLGRPQVVELRVKVSSEERTSRRGDAPRAKQRTTKKRAGRQHRTKAVIVDCPSVCPNCGHSTSGGNEGN